MRQQKKIERQQKKIEKEKLRKIYKKDLDKLKGPFLAGFKQIYTDLKKGIIHNCECECASCLYHFFKKRTPKSRIDKDNFFLYWLSYQFIKIKNNKKLSFLIKNSDIERNWDEILDLYCETTGVDKAYWKKRIDYPFRMGEHLRIITRYDKMYNIPRLIKAKKYLIDLLPFKISPFITEASRFLEIMKDRTDQELPPAVLLFPDETLIDFYEFICKARKVHVYIAKREEQKIFKLREIMKNCHIEKDDLLIIIEYLRRNKLININGKEASKSSEWEYWSRLYEDRINLMNETLKDIEPFSVCDAKEIFIEKILSSFAFYFYHYII